MIIKGIKGIIFDLDGTLVNSLPGLTMALNRSLTEVNLSVLSQDSVQQKVGHGMKELVRKALQEQNQDLHLWDHCFQRMVSHYQECWDQGMVVYPGISDLLVSMQRKKMDMAVNTNKEEGLALEVVQRFIPFGKETAVIGRSEDRPKKPDPQGVLELLNTLELNAQEVIYVGDSDVDIQTAKNASIPSVAVTWGFRSAGEIKRCNPDLLVNHPRDIEAIL